MESREKNGAGWENSHAPGDGGTKWNEGRHWRAKWTHIWFVFVPCCCFLPTCCPQFDDAFVRAHFPKYETAEGMRRSLTVATAMQRVHHLDQLLGEAVREVRWGLERAVVPCENVNAPRPPTPHVMSRLQLWWALPGDGAVAAMFLISERVD